MVMSVHRVTLLCVGSVKTSWIAEGCSEYATRLQRSVRLEIVELPASKQRDAEKQRREESDRVIEALKKVDGDAYVLDERGERMTSHEFSALFVHAADAGTPLTFVLGGAYGLLPEVKRHVRGSIRLSDMTFPHELCRLVFLEQVYRALEIARGSGYHH